MDSFGFSGYSMSNMVPCILDGNDIYQTDATGSRRPIGKSLAAYEELEETTKQYYDKLVELGVIIPEKTPQEMMAEMQGKMMEMQGTMLEVSKIISSLSNEVKELREGGSEQRTEHGGADVSQRKPVRSGGKSAAGDQRDNG